MTIHHDRPIPHRLGRHAAAVLGALTLVATSCGGDDVDDVADDAGDALDDAGDAAGDAFDDATGAVADAIDEVGEDTVEVAARNLASTHAIDEFGAAGYPIDGDLTCTADATDDLTAVDISCSGATEDGGVASMTGTTTELPGASVTEMEGDFVGFVDTEEVFRTDSLG